MARRMNTAQDAPVYRAVIVKPAYGGRMVTTCEGPYKTPGAAQARLTFWTNYYEDAHTPVTGYVEEGTTTWTRLSSG